MMFILPAPPPAAISQPAGEAACRFHPEGDHWAGSCGAVFDETPTFVLSRAKAIATGVWKAGARPTAVWAGRLISAGDPDYPVEIELYGDKGVLRSEYGWHAVSGFKATARSLSFRMDAGHELAPNALDRQILRRADAMLSSPAVWNRVDNRQCPPNAASWSIYCAAEQATVEVTGGFHHRRPAMELVREIVEARSKGRPYKHRLMDYNNDLTTTLADVHSLFAEALARIPG
jgi:hypothetical protein